MFTKIFGNYALSEFALVESARIGYGDNTLTVRQGSKILLTDLIRKKIINLEDVRRSQVLLMQERNGNPVCIQLRNDVTTFRESHTIVAYTIDDSRKGPILTVIDINDGRKIKHYIAKITNSLGRCSVCARKLVPHTTKHEPIMDDTMALCPCLTTRYCSVTCQAKDWHKFGHQKVHDELMKLRN